MFRTVIGNYILLQQPQLPLKQMLVLICCIMSAAYLMPGPGGGLCAPQVNF